MVVKEILQRKRVKRRFTVTEGMKERERKKNKEQRAPQKGIKGPQLGFHILINIELKEGR